MAGVTVYHRVVTTPPYKLTIEEREGYLHALIEGEQMATPSDPDDLQLGSVVAQQRYETCDRSELPARLSIDMEPLQEDA